ncbi:hypothetical protein Dda_3592 [Drechslerella dactyloides]|uniref:xylulokinase n=1 Tax=Drechslerella dactyloides TaxID=74499 RepID=A0AAD6IYP9_DREDA|nr:hypothetical protein Dda_3592 [Drechslerella dactyloides]
MLRPEGRRRGKDELGMKATMMGEVKKVDGGRRGRQARDAQKVVDDPTTQLPKSRAAATSQPAPSKPQTLNRDTDEPMPSRLELFTRTMNETDQFISVSAFRRRVEAPCWLRQGGASLAPPLRNLLNIRAMGPLSRPDRSTDDTSAAAGPGSLWLPGGADGVQGPAALRLSIKAAQQVSSGQSIGCNRGMASEPLYLGLDLSTQQLKVLAIESSLETVFEEAVSFDADLPSYGVHKGVFVNDTDHEVYAPVAMWIEALDLILQRMKNRGFDFSRVKGISGAGQQHGSVDAGSILSTLSPDKTLLEQLAPAAFSWEFSPNWQDHSTSSQLHTFEDLVGGPDALAQATGSSGHHRFTGPQILRFVQLRPAAYVATSRISLVSSFLASLLLGRIAPLDISDVCGMNLYNMETHTWDPRLIALAASPSGTDDAATAALYDKLGPVEPDGGKNLGCISRYFCEKYGFPASCAIMPSTGDNPSTILALPLHPQDAIVSLGTSTTILMSTSHYYPSEAYHLFNHPTTPGLYMFMLCYKNGGLAREKIRDAINTAAGVTDHSWALFNQAAVETPVLGRTPSSPSAKVGFYFPLPEIVPHVRKPGTYRFHIDSSNNISEASPSNTTWPATSDARAILESQALSMRIRSSPLLDEQTPRPRRVYFVGGGSKNSAMARVLNDVLGGHDGVYKLDVGNACALGAAYKALWAVERKADETFEQLIGQRWNEEGKVEKIMGPSADGVWEAYGEIAEGYLAAEARVVKGEAKVTKQSLGVLIIQPISQALYASRFSGEHWSLLSFAKTTHPHPTAIGAQSTVGRGTLTPILPDAIRVVRLDGLASDGVRTCTEDVGCSHFALLALPSPPSPPSSSSSKIETLYRFVTMPGKLPTSAYELRQPARICSVLTRTEAIERHSCRRLEERVIELREMGRCWRGSFGVVMNAGRQPRFSTVPSARMLASSFHRAVAWRCWMRKKAKRVFMLIAGTVSRRGGIDRSVFLRETPVLASTSWADAEKLMKRCWPDTSAPRAVISLLTRGTVDGGPAWDELVEEADVVLLLRALLGVHKVVRIGVEAADFVVDRPVADDGSESRGVERDDGERLVKGCRSRVRPSVQEVQDAVRDAARIGLKLNFGSRMAGDHHELGQLLLACQELVAPVSGLGDPELPFVRLVRVDGVEERINVDQIERRLPSALVKTAEDELRPFRVLAAFDMRGGLVRKDVSSDTPAQTCRGSAALGDQNLLHPRGVFPDPSRRPGDEAGQLDVTRGWLEGLRRMVEQLLKRKPAHRVVREEAIEPSRDQAASCDIEEV